MRAKRAKLEICMSSMESVLSGPQSNFGTFNFRPPQKTSFFSRRPLASSKKKLVFFSSTFSESSKIRFRPERTDSILL